MEVKELIERLKNYSEDAKVCFYDFFTCNDMFLKDISVADDNTEIYFNISR